MGTTSLVPLSSHRPTSLAVSRELSPSELGLSSGISLNQLDPRAKFVLVFCFGMAYFKAVDVSIWLELIGCVFALVLLAQAGSFRTVIGLSVFIAFTYVMQFTVIPMLGYESVIGLALSMVFVIFRKFIPPFVMLMVLVLSTRTAHLISALQKMHVPQGPAVALAVLFRFFPTVSEQFRAIRGAMRIKGIPLTFGNFFTHPIRTFEYCIVPLMASSLKIGNELSCAALCRGLGYSERRTSIVEARLGVFDYLCMVISIGIAVFFTLWHGL